MTEGGHESSFSISSDGSLTPEGSGSLSSGSVVTTNDTVQPLEYSTTPPSSVNSHSDSLRRQSSGSFLPEEAIEPNNIDIQDGQDVSQQQQPVSNMSPPSSPQIASPGAIPRPYSFSDVTTASEDTVVPNTVPRVSGTPSEAPSSYHNQMVNTQGHIPRRAVPSIAGNIQGYPHSNATSSLSGYQLPASVSNDQVNFIARRNEDSIVKCYQIFSLYLIVPVFSPIIMMYVISDYLCIDTLICMRITVSIGMLFALTSLFISAWYERKYRKCKAKIKSFLPGYEV